MTSQPKYSLLEIERRWLAEERLLPDLASLPVRIITDKYLDSGRLRLRKIEGADAVQFKLCKKYGKCSEFSEPITNLYLTPEEYELLSVLPGRMLVRQRFTYLFQNVPFSINVIVGNAAPVIVEREFASEAEAGMCDPPPFCTEEVSGRAEYEAIMLAENV
ncbi:CYTH domain-containing protein [Gimesia maris]|uniref:CYTH domain-containing protein n=1 Tax=Gimesia maris TaxID=122 RepID=A0ABX5YHI9_9PLAN|nr:hypothetical protein [Gimesia maris]EDL61564.1 hypothetical protein PM8797T_04665 [Gimesia maris DSM 8797]QEG15037.1 hypothetical protein GmarT_08750 [Gimesia maris]